MRAFTVIASLVLLTFSSCTVKKASNDARMHPYDSAYNNQNHIAVKEMEKGYRTSPQSAPQTPVTTQKPALSVEEERFSSLADMKSSMKKEAKQSEAYAAPAARRLMTAKCKTRSSAATAQCYAPAPPPEAFVIIFLPRFSAAQVASLTTG